MNSFEHWVGYGLMVGVVGPLFWLGVNMLERWIKSTRWGRWIIPVDAWLADLPGSLVGRRKSRQHPEAPRQLTRRG